MIDSVSVEEPGWSPESQVLIPAEHIWCDFKYRPWDKNSSPNTNVHMGTVMLDSSKTFATEMEIQFWNI